MQLVQVGNRAAATYSKLFAGEQQTCVGMPGGLTTTARWSSSYTICSDWRTLAAAGAPPRAPLCTRACSSTRCPPRTTLAMQQRGLGMEFKARLLSWTYLWGGGLHAKAVLGICLSKGGKAHCSQPGYTAALTQHLLPPGCLFC